MPCVLCDAVPKEPILWENDRFVVVATKNAKGHVFRTMLVSRAHVHPKELPVGFEMEALALARAWGMRARGLDHGFAIYRDTYSSIPDHWHVIVADLLSGDDHEQVLDTPRIEFTRAFPQGRELDARRTPTKPTNGS